MLENFEPKDVFYWFEELSKIPRCSRQEKKVSDFLVDFAKKRNLEVYQDHEKRNQHSYKKFFPNYILHIFLHSLILYKFF